MIEINIKISGRGWIEFKITDFAVDIGIAASYISDAPQDFISCINSLIEGAASATCRIQSEPTEYRIVFSHGDSNMSMMILEFDQSFSRMPDQSGRIVFKGTEDLIRFTKRIIQQFNSLKATYGMDRYQETWGYPFPDNQLNRLSRSLEKYGIQKTTFK